MDVSIDTFTSFTGASADVARRYLDMTDNNAEQAIQLFFDSPDLASGVGEGPSSAAPPVPNATRPPPRVSGSGRPDAQGVINLDSEDDAMDIEQDYDNAAARAAREADVEDDAAMARRMQEELYTGGDASSGFDADGVRAPMARTTETLVGDLDGGWSQDNMQAAVLQQMRARQQPRSSGTTIHPISLSCLMLRTYRSTRCLQPASSPIYLGRVSWCG